MISLTRVALVVIVAAGVSAFVVTVDPTSNVSGGTSTTSTSSPTTGSTSTTTIATTDPAALITAGPSRNQCLTPNIPANAFGVSYVQAAVSSFDNETESLVTCLSAYLNSAKTWTQWEHPWVTDWAVGYSTWVAQQPQVRQLILAISPIPVNLANEKDPLKWESACALGKYNGHVSQLGKSLVAAGLQNSVIRLGPEMNGIWESYFMGATVAEQHRWATCFRKEVIALRSVAGEHFLIDWNPNACKGNYPWVNFYPGNSYVDIVGLDLYDVGCMTPTRSLTFSQLAGEPEGLAYFEAFAMMRGKPMSLPEWGLSSIPAGDDPGYIEGIGSTFDNGDFAYESYFEGTGPNVKALPLGPRTPLSVAAFKEWFGSQK